MSNACVRAVRKLSVGAMVWVVACVAGAAAQTPRALLIVAHGKHGGAIGGDGTALGFDQVARLDEHASLLAAKLLEDIDRGQIDEAGPGSPRSLQAFSDVVLSTVPDIFAYKSIHILSDALLPIELVHKEGLFVGDRVATSHEFGGADQRNPRPSPREVRLASYIIEAAEPMPKGSPRAGQDIIQVALELEQVFSVELHLNPMRGSILRSLGRDDVGILHIDTHGAEKGRAIQVTYAGDLLPASDIPQRVRVPLILLFGCEGVADRQAFGSVARERGAEAVISSFAKFESFGLTGDASREKHIYQAFFDALRAGDNVGSALLRLRQVANDQIGAAATRRTLTRNFFVLLGNPQLHFKWPG